MKKQYIEKNFSKQTLITIDQANSIIEEYQDENLDLTLRQLYYQFVSRDIFPYDRCWSFVNSKWIKDDKGTKNADPNYKWLGNIVSDGRLAGLIDWDVIEDRARNFEQYYHNTDPGEAVRDALRQFSLDKWLDQPYYVEVWIEKEALAGVVEQACKPLDVPYFACKGYNSQSEMWRAAMRMKERINHNQKPIIIHLGDHDPSGIDMTRDIIDRHDLFIKDYDVTVERIALNYNQVEEYKPPPNPAKLTDTRAKDYIKKYGDSSWELDAIEPRIMRKMISDTIEKYIDFNKMNAVKQQEEEYKEVLKNVADNWESL